MSLRVYRGFGCGGFWPRIGVSSPGPGLYACPTLCLLSKHVKRNRMPAKKALTDACSAGILAHMVDLIATNAAKGGRARASVLTDDQRKTIARAAAQARWGTKNPEGQASTPPDQQSNSEKKQTKETDEDVLPIALFPGKIAIGGTSFAVYVLDNRKRVMAQKTGSFLIFALTLDAAGGETTSLVGGGEVSCFPAGGEGSISPIPVSPVPKLTRIPSPVSETGGGFEKPTRMRRPNSIK